MRLDGASAALSIALALALAATLLFDRQSGSEAVAIAEDAAATLPETPSAPEPAGVREPITLPPPPVREAAAAQAVAAVAPARTLVPSQPDADPDIAPLTPRPRAVEPALAPTIEPLRPEPASEAPPEIVEPNRPAPEVPAPATVALPGEVEDAPWDRPAETAPSDGSVATTSEAAVAEGRALLRILEHGSGPVIEIAWPDAPGDREELFRRFRGCFGMRLALIDGQGRLYTRDGPPGRPAAIDLDRLSGFVRQPAGEMSAAERRQLEDMRAYHRGRSGLAPVRLFPPSCRCVPVGRDAASGRRGLHEGGSPARPLSVDRDPRTGRGDYCR